MSDNCYRIQDAEMCGDCPIKAACMDEETVNSARDFLPITKIDAFFLYGREAQKKLDKQSTEDERYDRREDEDIWW